MSHTEQEPAFARGIAGPLGKLDRDLKTKVDEHTEEQFRRHCALQGVDPSTMLRDCVYALVYQRTYRQMVVDKLSHDMQRNDAIAKLIGPFGALESNGGANA